MNTTEHFLKQKIEVEDEDLLVVKLQPCVIQQDSSESYKYFSQSHPVESTGNQQISQA